MFGIQKNKNIFLFCIITTIIVFVFVVLTFSVNLNNIKYFLGSLIPPCPGEMSGDGLSAVTACEVTNWTQLNSIRGDYLVGVYYKLTENLSSTTDGYDTVGNDWTPIGDGDYWDDDGNLIQSAEPFTGNFNGNNKTISDLIINKPGLAYIGLFGHTTGNISNIGLINVNATSNVLYNLIGGLVGYQGVGIITNSYSTGSISGESAGGLVGWNIGGTITNSYSTASVTGSYGGGGLVGGMGSYDCGDNCGSVTNSYSTGSITGSYMVGGLVGNNNGGTVNNSFWDKETSGQATSDGGTGKTTAEMKTLATFSDASWDISANVNYLNNGYPYLSGTSPVWYIASKFADGDGTELDPYQIETWIHLNNVRDYLSSYFILNADLSDADGDYGDYGDSWTPIGTNENRFSGNFDGNNHTISDLIVNLLSTNYVGLFGYVTGDISNVGLIDVNITGNQYVGGLVGRSNEEITNSYSTGSVTGSVYTGGLVGQTHGTISSSYSAVSVIGGYYVGGLVGDQVAGTISNSYSTGSVSGSNGVGGLVGQQVAGAISNSYSTGAVTGTYGGGGLVGDQWGGTIANSFWDETTSGQTTMCVLASGTGCDNANGKTTPQMKKLFTFNENGGNWNILGGQTDLNNGYPYLSGTSPIWYIADNTTSLFAGGDGTELDPYQIESWMHLNNVRDHLDSYFILNADLSDADGDYGDYGDSWTPIGIPENLPFGIAEAPFSGNFDGGGHTISDLIVNLPSTNYIGLFGYATGDISDVGLIDVNITGRNYVGGLVGQQVAGTISNSYSTGSVDGHTYVGGVVGRTTGTITKSYSTGAVTGVFSSGGLVGRSSGTINNSYSTGSVTGSNNVGGFVGENIDGAITNSYSTGSVSVSGSDSVGGFVAVWMGGTITNSFWDKTTSGQTTSAGGTGKTTVKMKGLYTYNSNGGNWSITGGAPNLNNGYPYLSGSSPIWLIPSTTIYDPAIGPGGVSYYTIIASAGPNGSVSPSGSTSLASGSNQTYTISPATGYQIADVLVDNVSVGAVANYIFNSINNNHTISATFSAKSVPSVCTTSVDCGISNYTGSPFCQKNNVHQNYITHTCTNPGLSNSLCTSTTINKLKTTCTSNQICDNGSCISQPIGGGGSDVGGGGAGNTIVELPEIITEPVVTEKPTITETIVKALESQIPEAIKVVAVETQKIINSPEGSTITKVVSTAGFVATATVASSSLPFSVLEIFFFPLRIFGLLMTALGIRKRVVSWGAVYDSVTKRPLDPVYVILKNIQGKVISSSITDVDGRYGFLVGPGIYQIEVHKTNYTFPSQKLAGKTNDELYNDLYFGENIEVKELNEVIIKNIPLDPIKFDWNEFAKKDKKLMKFYSKWDIALKKFYTVFSIIGFAVAIIAYIFAPYIYNAVIIGLYLLLLLIRFLGLKPKSYGYITDKVTGTPLSFAIVRIMMPGSNREITARSADKYGKYYCLVPPGKYYVNIEKKNNDGSYSLVYTSSDIDVTRKGIINKKFEV